MYKECYYLILGMSLEQGLRYLKTNYDHLDMIEAVKGYEEIEFYIEHVVSEPEEVPMIDGIEDVGCGWRRLL